MSRWIGFGEVCVARMGAGNGRGASPITRPPEVSKAATDLQGDGGAGDSHARVDVPTIQHLRG